MSRQTLADSGAHKHPRLGAAPFVLAACLLAACGGVDPFTSVAVEAESDAGALVESSAGGEQATGGRRAAGGSAGQESLTGGRESTGGASGGQGGASVDAGATVDAPGAGGAVAVDAAPPAVDAGSDGTPVAPGGDAGAAQDGGECDPEQCPPCTVAGPFPCCTERGACGCSWLDNGAACF